MPNLDAVALLEAAARDESPYRWQLINVALVLRNKFSLSAAVAFSAPRA
jgi:hypothetical protein